MPDADGVDKIKIGPFTAYCLRARLDRVRQAYDLLSYYESSLEEMVRHIQSERELEKRIPFHAEDWRESEEISLDGNFNHLMEYLELEEIQEEKPNVGQH